MKCFVIFCILFGLSLGNDFKKNWGKPMVNPRYDMNWITSKVIQWNENGNVYWFHIPTRSTVNKIGRNDVQKLFGSKANTTKFEGFNDDQSLVVFSNEIEAPNFWQKKALYYIVNGRMNVYKVEENNGRQEKLQLFKFVPGSTNFIYAHDNNLFIGKYPATGSGSSNHVQLTFDGTEDLVNGPPSTMMRFSLAMEKDGPLYMDATGSSLAYGQYNMSAFKDQYILRYGNDDKKNIFPTLHREKMAKAGDPNIPSPKLFAVENLDQAFTASGKITNNEVMPPSAVGAQYLWENLKWVSPTELHVDWINRANTQKVKTICKKVVGKTSYFCNTKSSVDYRATNGYVSSIVYDTTQPLFTSDGKYVFDIQDYKVPESSRTYHQIVRIQLKDGPPSMTFITKDSFTVTAIKSYDKVNDVLYFMGFGKDLDVDGGSLAMHLYKITKVIKPGRPPVTTCVTCSYVTSNKEYCLFNRIDFSPDGKYYIQRCSGPNNAVGVFLRLTKDDSLVHTLDGNTKVKARFATNNFFPKKLFTTTPITNKETGKKYIIPTLVRLPWSLTKTQSYPVIVYSYNGPMKFVSTDLANPVATMAGFMDYMVLNHGVVVLSVDGRGTPGQSQEYRYEEHGKVGIPGSEDQLTVLYDHIQRRPLFQVDHTRIAMVGHSLGGYLTLLTMIKDNNNLIKCGVAINPITSWRLAYPQYSETYLGLDTKDGNAKRYDDTSIIKNYERLRGKKFMIVTATADTRTTNHLANVLMRNLQEKEIDFEAVTLVDDDHTFSKHRKFTYGKIFRYLAEPSCLNLSTPF